MAQKAGNMRQYQCSMGLSSLYFMDNQRHHAPHIHATYQEHEAVIAIPDGEVLEGALPPTSKMKLVHAWVELHQDELLADWTLVVSGQQP